MAIAPLSQAAATNCTKAIISGFIESSSCQASDRSIRGCQRASRVANAQRKIFALLDHDQKEFVEFVLSKYIETGVEELDQEKLPQLLELKYQAVSDAAEKLGGVSRIRSLFVEFQRHLYA